MSQRVPTLKSRLTFNLLCCFAGWCHTAAVAAPPVEALSQRLELLQEITLEYDHDTEYFPNQRILEPELLAALEPEVGQPVDVAYLQRGIMHLRERFAFSRGRVLHEYTLGDETLQEVQKNGWPDDYRRVFAISDRRADLLVVGPGREQGNGFIQETMELPTTFVVDAALGLRFRGASMWIRVDDIKNMDFAPHDGLVVAKTENVAGNDHLWYLDPSKGWAVIAYHVITPTGFLLWRVTNEEFEQAGDVFLPHRIVAERYARGVDGMSELREKSVLRVTSVKVAEVDDGEVFSVIWPRGSDVWDSRHGIGVRIGNTDRRLDDKFIESLVAERKVPPGQKNIPDQDGDRY